MNQHPFTKTPIQVFIADDHTVIRDSLRLLIESQGNIRVVGEASDGHETFTHTRRIRPDIVLMDIAMPRLNGIEATRLIRKECPETRVVILSMYATTEHIYHAFQAGAAGYLLKESAGVEVIQAIKAVHSGQRYLSKRIDKSTIEHYLSHHRGKGPLESLSRREHEVLQLVVEGKTSAEIADILSLSRKTVETYRSRLMKKLHVKNVPGLVKFAILHGLTTPV